MVTLNSGKPEKTKDGGLNAILAAAKASGQGLAPVNDWHPEYCGAMDLVIRRDGTWWHEGTQITRAPLIKLFARVLRKDEDGETYLVTPVEKIKIKVECAPFLIVRVDIMGAGKNQSIFATTNVGDVVEIGPDHPIDVKTDTNSRDPVPLVRIRGRLDALFSRPTYYELVDHAIERASDLGTILGVMSGGTFFPLGPPLEYTTENREGG